MQVPPQGRICTLEPRDGDDTNSRRPGCLSGHGCDAVTREFPRLAQAATEFRVQQTSPEIGTLTTCGGGHRPQHDLNGPRRGALQGRQPKASQPPPLSCLSSRKGVHCLSHDLPLSARTHPPTGARKSIRAAIRCPSQQARREPGRASVWQFDVHDSGRAMPAVGRQVGVPQHLPLL